MNHWRFVAIAALTVGLGGSAVAWLSDLGSAGVERTGAAPIVDRPSSQPSYLAANAEAAAPPPAAASDNPASDGADIAAAAESGTAPDTKAAEPEATAAISPANPPQAAPDEPQPVQVATASPPDATADDAKEALGAVTIPGDCPAAAADDGCIDRYLWALYQRTPKEDTIKVYERKKVTVRKKRKTVTVTRTITRLVDEDFTWKDPKAAERARMSLMVYVIGGMDRSFKLKLYRTLRAADEAGLAPGITSAFRDDYRQSLASGLKAATDRSYHGGSFRGGYGHGVAADIVSVKGDTRDQRFLSSETLWKWVDAHATEFGVARPYLDRDPPHVAPIDGQEYASHHRATTVQHTAKADVKKRKRLAARSDHSAAKRARSARSSKVRTI